MSISKQINLALIVQWQALVQTGMSVVSSFSRRSNYNGHDGSRLYLSGPVLRNKSGARVTHISVI